MKKSKLSLLFLSSLALITGVASTGVAGVLANQSNVSVARASSPTWNASSGALGTTDGATFKIGDNTWTVSRKSSSLYTGFTSSCVQIGKNGGAESFTLTSSSYDKTVKSVSVTCGSYSAKHTVSITVGGTSYLSSKSTASWQTTSALKGTGSSSGVVVIDVKAGSGARAFYLKSIVIELDDGEIVSVESVSVSKQSLRLEKGKTSTLTATVSPSNASNQAVTWSSDTPSVATVDNNGKVTAVSKGTSTITVTTSDGAKTATCVVTVVELVSISVSGTPNKTDYYNGQRFDSSGLVVTGTYNDDSTVKLTTNLSWSKAVVGTDETVTCTYNNLLTFDFNFSEVINILDGSYVYCDSFGDTSGILDDEGFIEYAAEQGTSSTAPIVSDGVIRVYQNGGLFKLSSTKKLIKSIEIGSEKATTVSYSIDDGDFSESYEIEANGTITIDAISAKKVVFKCLGTTTSTRLYVNSLGVLYADDPNYSNTDSIVTFENSSLDSVIIKEGESLAKPVDPSKDGYAFAYWCSDEALQNEISWPLQVNGDTTIYAKWVSLETTAINLLPNESADYYRVTGKLVARTDVKEYYLQDATGSIMLYGFDAANLGYVVGDSISVSGKISTYNGSLEMTNHVDVQASSPVSVTPLTSIDDATVGNYGKYIELENLTLSSDLAEKTNIAVDESDAFTLRYKSSTYLTIVGETPSAGKKVSIKGVVGVYKTQVQLMITEISLVESSDGTILKTDVVSGFCNESGLEAVRLVGKVNEDEFDNVTEIGFRIRIERDGQDDINYTRKSGLNLYSTIDDSDDYYFAEENGYSAGEGFLCFGLVISEIPTTLDAYLYFTPYVVISGITYITEETMVLIDNGSVTID